MTAEEKILARVDKLEALMVQYKSLIDLAHVAVEAFEAELNKANAKIVRIVKAWDELGYAMPSGDLSRAIDAAREGTNVRHN